MILGHTFSLLLDPPILFHSRMTSFSFILAYIILAFMICEPQDWSTCSGQMPIYKLQPWTWRICTMGTSSTNYCNIDLYISGLDRDNKRPRLQARGSSQALSAKWFEGTFWAPWCGITHSQYLDGTEGTLLHKCLYHQFTAEKLAFHKQATENHAKFMTACKTMDDCQIMDCSVRLLALDTRFLTI